MTALSAHHVGITVANLEETLAFYRDVLDLPVADRFSVGGEAFSDAVGVEGASAEFAHLEADGARIELVEYEPEARVPDGGAQSTGCFPRRSLGRRPRVLRRSAPEDVPTLSEPRTTESGTTIMFLRDPEGT